MCGNSSRIALLELFGQEKASGEVDMNTDPNESVSLEEHTEVVHETQDGLVEVGAVSETKGGLYGAKTDNGLGQQIF
jgi:hypothetical protein